MDERDRPHSKCASPPGQNSTRDVVAADNGLPGKPRGYIRLKLDDRSVVHRRARGLSEAHDKLLGDALGEGRVACTPAVGR